MERSVLATLSYGAALNTPLTAVQVWQRCIAPARVGAQKSPTLGAVVRTLGELAAQGRVWERNGWYLPAGQAGRSLEADDDLFERRLDQANMNTGKWRHMLRRAWIFQAVPFVRALAASGSLAAGTTGRESDWDMFVIARHGRLYTARLGLVLVAKLQGRLRTKRHRTAPDRFCFNHYVTDRGLKMRHRSLFVADALARLVPFYDPGNLCSRLAQANGWVRTYRAQGVSYVSHGRRELRRSRTLGVVRRALELVLASPLGTGLEAVVRIWQQRRIAREPATHARGGRIIADEQEIEFHPRSAERGVLARYNAALVELGVPLTERDSGLN